MFKHADELIRVAFRSRTGMVHLYEVLIMARQICWKVASSFGTIPGPWSPFVVTLEWMASHLSQNAARFASACSTADIIAVFQIICHFFALFPEDKIQAVAHQVDDAELCLHYWESGLLYCRCCCQRGNVVGSRDFPSSRLAWFSQSVVWPVA